MLAARVWGTHKLLCLLALELTLSHLLLLCRNARKNHLAY